MAISLIQILSNLSTTIQLSKILIFRSPSKTIDCEIKIRRIYLPRLTMFILSDYDKR